MEGPVTKDLKFLVKQDSSIQKKDRRCNCSLLLLIVSNTLGIWHFRSSNSEVSVQQRQSSGE